MHIWVPLVKELLGPLVAMVTRQGGPGVKIAPRSDPFWLCRSALRPFLNFRSALQPLLSLHAPTYFGTSAPRSDTFSISAQRSSRLPALLFFFLKSIVKTLRNRENIGKFGKKSALRAPTYFFFCAPRSSLISKITPRSRTPPGPSPVTILKFSSTRESMKIQVSHS